MDCYQTVVLFAGSPSHLQNHSRHNILVKRRHLHTLTVLDFMSSNIQMIRSENGELFLL